MVVIRVELDREDDGRWFGDVPSLPGVIAYGQTEAEARANTLALAFRVIADRIEHHEPLPDEIQRLIAA